MSGLLSMSPIHYIGILGNAQWIVCDIYVDQRSVYDSFVNQWGVCDISMSTDPCSWTVASNYFYSISKYILQQSMNGGCAFLILTKKNLGYPNNQHYHLIYVDSII